MKKLKELAQKDINRIVFWVLVVAVFAFKAFISRYQLFFTWIDGAPLDDELMFEAAQSITAGNWLGEYGWLTLSKHMFFAIWLSFLNAVHIPYLMGGQLLTCAASLACAMAFKPVLRRNKSQFLVFALLAFNPASMAAFTLRVYRDNIFPSLCMLFFAGLCGYALRWRNGTKKALPWLVLCGVGLATAWLTREDGVWLMPFAVIGCAVLLIAALREKQGAKRLVGRIAALLVPFALLGVGIGTYSAINYAHYGVFVVSDFSGGSFADAMGAMNRVKEDEWIPLVSVPEDVRRKIYETVPCAQPLEAWLEDYQPFRNSYVNPAVNDYQAGGFYWAVRRAAECEGMYESAKTAEQYWRQMADEINALCDNGTLPSESGKRSGTTPPIKAQHILPVIQEGLKSIAFVATFQDCAPYEAEELSVGLPEDVAVWAEYLGNGCNLAAIENTAVPYYSTGQRLVYFGLECIQLVYAVALPLALVAALVLQARHGLALLKQRKNGGIKQGDAMLWTLLLGLFGMAILRCFMIAFMEVSSFNIGTYVMYLSTVHPLFILFAAVGCLSLWRKNA